jgi:hypothetical protein
MRDKIMSFPQPQGVNIITINHLNQQNLKKCFGIVVSESGRIWPESGQILAQTGLSG